MESRPGAPAAYVERTEATPPRPPIGETPVEMPKSNWQNMKAQWEELTAEEQEAVLVDGAKWIPGQKPIVPKKKKQAVQ